MRPTAKSQARNTARLRRLPALLLAAMLASNSFATLDLPDRGDPAEQALPDYQARSIGASSVRQLEASGAFLDDPEVNAYLDQLGHRLVSSSAEITGSFAFFAIDSPEINAFALPGGYVGVNSGLILATNNESELASVLAHEISHITQQHVARQLQAQSGSQIAALAGLLAAVVAAGSGNGEMASAAIAGVTAGQLQSQINFTRENEEEADRLGFKLLIHSGFDGRGMAELFRTLQQRNRLAESDQPSWLRSHPLTTQRIAEAEDRALSAPYRQVRDSIDFLMVRALLRSYQGEPAETLAALQQALDANPPRARQNALRYGLAAAQLRAGNFDAALELTRALEADRVEHPMIAALVGQIHLQARHHDEAIAHYEAALSRYPDHLQLVLDYPRALIKAGRPAEAARFAERRLSTLRGNAQLHRIAAEAYAGAGRPMASHYQLGEYYALAGNQRGAREQFELALNMRDADEFTLARVQARLRELRAAMKTDGKGDERQGDRRGQRG